MARQKQKKNCKLCNTPYDVGYYTSHLRKYHTKKLQQSDIDFIYNTRSCWDCGLVNTIRIDCITWKCEKCNSLNTK